MASDGVPFGDSEGLEAAITANTVAFLVEPIQGEGGIVIPPEGYLTRCAEICRRHNVLLICDEVQTGLGRTGKMFAFQHENIAPDGLILGKALGGGILPVSMFLARREVMDVFRPGDHGSTFGGNPLAATIALEALNILLEEDLVKQSADDLWALTPAGADEALRLLGASKSRLARAQPFAAGRAERAKLRLALDASRLGARRVFRLPPPGAARSALLREVLVWSQIHGLRFCRLGPGCGLVDLIMRLLVDREVKAVFVETSVPQKNVKALLEGADAVLISGCHPGDCHYIKKHLPDDLEGKSIITNTTTPEDIELFRQVGISTLVTTTPSLDGRSFGTNMMEAALVAVSGEGRPLTLAELDQMIAELDFQPEIQDLN